MISFAEGNGGHRDAASVDTQAFIARNEMLDNSY